MSEDSEDENQGPDSITGPDGIKRVRLFEKRYNGTASEHSDNDIEMSLLERKELAANNPSRPEYYKKRVCIRAVEDENSPGKCVGCKKDAKAGAHISWETKWTPDVCTKLEPTDAYGKVRFGEYGKVANFVRVDYKTEPEELIQLLYGQDGWKLNRPHLLISVTGGAQNFTIPQRMKTAFKNGLIKAATSTNAWIITGGTNTGVMKLVGEAVAESIVDLSKLTVLGIASWGRLDFKEQLIPVEDEENTDDFLIEREVEYTTPKFHLVPDGKYGIVRLDPNHSHFILADDGSNDEYGIEINLRAKLENELTLGRPSDYYAHVHKLATENAIPRNSIINDVYEKIPMILIVVQGGPRTLETIVESVEKGVPVLVLAESKGCADVIANAMTLKDKSDDKLFQLLCNSKMFYNKKMGFNDDTKCRNAVKGLKKILFKSDLVNVFNLDSDAVSHDIELAILKVFLNSRKTHYYENLKLAIRWNQVEIAKTHIFTGEERFDFMEFLNVMETAIVEDKPDFVELLVEQHFNFKDFLTEKRLCFLYNSDKIQKSGQKPPITQLIKNMYSKYKLGYRKILVTSELIKKFCRDIGLEEFDLLFLHKEQTQLETFVGFCKQANLVDNSYNVEKYYQHFASNEVFHSVQNLFLWAVLHNRIGIAKVFWKIGRYHICNALFASALLKKMAVNLKDYRAELLQHAEEFEDLATGVLNVFDMHTDDRININILMSPVPFFNIHSLQMALIADCKRFVAHPAVQNLLTYIWNGQISDKIGFVTNFKFFISCVSLGTLAPFFMSDEDDWLSELSEKQDSDSAVIRKKKARRLRELVNQYLANKETVVEDSDDEEQRCCRKKRSNSGGIYYRTEESVIERHESIQKINPFTKYWNRLVRFTNIPKVLFFYDAVFYVVFLLLFSYMLLCNFTYLETYEHLEKHYEFDNATNKSVEISSIIVLKIRVARPSPLLIFLAFWVVTFLCEELRQFATGAEKTTSFCLKIKRYFNDNWNYLDLSGCLFFIIGFLLRILAFILEDKEVFTAARLVLSIDLFIWYVRILHVTLVFKSLGPKLVMIRKMIKDLVFFITIIGIFVCAFGITTQATLYPNNKLDIGLIKNIIDKAYWPIYGEMKILDDDLNKECSENPDSCPEPAGIAFSYAALMVYMLVANVLLINLLIAMFSSTFSHVEENTDKIWKFQRYRLIFEYKNIPILPPPLIFISHVIQLFKTCSKRKKNQNKKKTKEEDENDALLYDNEKKYAYIHLRLEKAKEEELAESKLKLNSTKLEKLEQKLNELVQNKERENEQIHEALNWIMHHISREKNLADVPRLKDTPVKSD